MTIKRLLCLAVCAVGLLAGCGPEAAPAGPVAVAENTAISQEQTTIEAVSATPVISATAPATDVTPTVSATLTPTLDISEFPNPDSFKIDIFQRWNGWSCLDFPVGSRAGKTPYRTRRIYYCVVSERRSFGLWDFGWF